MPCLIFDLDGTLVDSLPGIAGSLNRTLAAHGMPVHSCPAIRAFIGGGLRLLVEHAAPAGTAPSLIDALVVHYKQDYDLTWASNSFVYDGIHEMLGGLQERGFQLGVLSNKIHDFTVVMTRAVFPHIHFVQILGQREGIPQKPHAAGAIELARAFGVAPGQCVLIGDSTIDLETAANAGMPAVAVAWGYHDSERLIDAGATRLIRHPSELPGMLAELSDRRPQATD